MTKDQLKLFKLLKRVASGELIALKSDFMMILTEWEAAVGRATIADEFTEDAYNVGYADAMRDAEAERVEKMEETQMLPTPKTGTERYYGPTGWQDEDFATEHLKFKKKLAKK